MTIIHFPAHRRPKWRRRRLDSVERCDQAISHAWRMHAVGLLSWNDAARRDQRIRQRRDGLARKGEAA